ncbi:MAG: FeoB-associated Cys-rich membrane protein [Pyrinomonadaceae bacterium]|nr:FeoB-associated Cys-rich membrane protein [Pyrinomonadaceae bacterium]
MNIQTFIVALIVFGACFYVGRIAWKKMKSFSTKSSCGIDCGCGTPTKVKKINKKIEV